MEAFAPAECFALSFDSFLPFDPLETYSSIRDPGITMQV